VHDHTKLHHINANDVIVHLMAVAARYHGHCSSPGGPVIQHAGLEVNGDYVTGTAPVFFATHEKFQTCGTAIGAGLFLVNPELP